MEVMEVVEVGGGWRRFLRAATTSPNLL